MDKDLLLSCTVGDGEWPELVSKTGKVPLQEWSQKRVPEGFGGEGTEGGLQLEGLGQSPKGQSSLSVVAMPGLTSRAAQAEYF